MPKVKVKYFARLRELIGSKEEEYEVEDGTALTDLLLKHVPARHMKVSKIWKETVFKMEKDEILLNKNGTPVLRDYLVLVKGKPPKLSYKLRDGDEIAVLPPAGGG